MTRREYADKLVENAKERQALMKCGNIKICEFEGAEVHIFEGIKSLAYGVGVKIKESDRSYYFTYDDVLFFEVKRDGIINDQMLTVV